LEEHQRMRCNDRLGASRRLSVDVASSRSFSRFNPDGLHARCDGRFVRSWEDDVGIFSCRNHSSMRRVIHLCRYQCYIMSSGN